MGGGETTTNGLWATVSSCRANLGKMSTNYVRCGPSCDRFEPDLSPNSPSMVHSLPKFWPNTGIDQTLAVSQKRPMLLENLAESRLPRQLFDNLWTTRWQLGAAPELAGIARSNFSGRALFGKIWVAANLWRNRPLRARRHHKRSRRKRLAMLAARRGGPEASTTKCHLCPTCSSEVALVVRERCLSCRSSYFDRAWA